LIIDTSGVLYGETQNGGKFNEGIVYAVVPNADKTKWKLKVLYDFCSKPNCADGVYPAFALTYPGAAAGALYDGISPLFGVTQNGGKYGAGVAYQLTFVDGRTRRKEKVIHNFCEQTNCADGTPPNQLVADAGGTLFGTAGYEGSNEGGVLFKLAPNAKGRFKQKVLYSFCSVADCVDGAQPLSPLTLGSDGSLFGTTQQGGTNRVGTVFKFQPKGSQETVLYSFCTVANCADGEAPLNSGVAMDSQGTLFGTTSYGGAGGDGTVYLLKQGVETVLKSFCEEQYCADGGAPIDGVIVDTAGDVFGATQSGGDHNGGVIFEITP
jgi:uncharacterized repeat protein (TIGR03803 family)